MKKKYIKLAGGKKDRLPKNVMVLTNIWTANQNCDAPASSGTVSVAAGATGTLNAECGVVTITGLNAAAGANQVATINNNKIAANSRIIATLNGYTGTWDTNGEPWLAQVTIAAGQMVIRIVNVNGANALNGNVTISFQVGQIVQ